MTPMERVCINGAAYKTPEGFYDVPYVYSRSYFFPDTAPNVTSTGALVTLVSDLVDTIPIDGDSDFILRKVGMNFSQLVGFNFQDALQYNYASQTLGLDASGQTVNGPIIVVPEKMFPAGGGIKYTIPLGTETVKLNYGVALAPPWIGYFNIYFQGVRRYRGVPDRKPNYRYWERMYTYVYTFNLNWLYLQTPYAAYQASPLYYFNQPISNYDFELMQIGILPSGTDALGYEIQLFDQAQVQTSNDPIPMNQCVSGNGQFYGGFTDQDSNNCFPVPSLLYPQNGNLRFAIRSLADTTNSNSGGTETIYFKGVQRIPC